MARILCVLGITLLITLVTTSRSYAAAKRPPNLEAFPYELVEAVNALRASYGLAPYTISSILMATAQNQADDMAATGRASHTGAGDSSVTDRLLAVSYPLDGDLSLAGFRAENVTSGRESMSAQAAVDQWAGDSVHLKTMISPDLTEIGAGVSVNNGKVYFVIDCARPTNSGVPQVLGTSVVGASTDPTSRGIPIPVAMATPNADGDIIHEVKEGQTLWQIAISYNTTIDEIKRLNNLFDNNIYPVTKLLIRKTVTLTPTLPVDYPTIEMASSPAQNPTVTVTALGATLTSTPLNPSLPASANNLIGIVIGILAVAILGGGIIAWLGSAKK
jgi:uncharacterized protein YkwD